MMAGARPPRYSPPFPCRFGAHRLRVRLGRHRGGLFSEIHAKIKVVVQLPVLGLQVFKRAVAFDNFRLPTWYCLACKYRRAIQVAGNAPPVYLDTPECGAQGADNCRKVLAVALLPGWLPVGPAVVLAEGVFRQAGGGFQPAGVNQRADFGEEVVEGHML